MKKKIIILLSSIILTFTLFTACASKTQQISLKAEADKYVEAFHKGDYELIYDNLIERNKAEFSKNDFINLIKDFKINYLVEDEKPELIEENSGYSFYSALYKIKTSGYPVNLFVDVNNQGKINSFIFKNSTELIKSEYKQEEMKFNSLSGYLMLPKSLDKFNVVILVGGSGPTDKDSSFGPNKLFVDVAEYFAKNSIATFRFDKRNLVAPNSIPENATVNDEFVNDVVDIYQMLRKDPRIKKIFVLGHSLGAMMIPRISTLIPADGYIMLAAPSEKIQELLYKQNKYLLELKNPNKEEIKKTLETIRKQVDNINNLTETSKTPKALMFGINKEYWLDLNAYDQVVMASEIKQPVFIGSGDNDYQVPFDNFLKYKEACIGDNFTLKAYKGMNHALNTLGKGPDCYNYRSNVSVILLEDIVKFIQENN